MTWKTTLKILGLMLIYLKCTNYIDISWFAIIFLFLMDILFSTLIMGLTNVMKNVLVNKSKGK